MMKLHIENEKKTKPENPGLEGRLNPGFGFEKSPGYPGSGKPGLQTLVDSEHINNRVGLHHMLSSLTRNI